MATSFPAHTPAPASLGSPPRPAPHQDHLAGTHHRASLGRAAKGRSEFESPGGSPGAITF